MKMSINFQQTAGLGYLKIKGRLDESDSTELTRRLALSMSKSQYLVLDLDNVTEISRPCLKILSEIFNMAEQWDTFLTFASWHRDEVLQSAGEWKNWKEMVKQVHRLNN